MTSMQENGTGRRLVQLLARFLRDIWTSSRPRNIAVRDWIIQYYLKYLTILSVIKYNGEWRFLSVCVWVKSNVFLKKLTANITRIRIAKCVIVVICSEIRFSLPHYLLSGIWIVAIFSYEVLFKIYCNITCILFSAVGTFYIMIS
jgi:hypothetical protein